MVEPESVAEPLRYTVLQRLDQLDRLAADAAPDRLRTLAAREIPLLVTALRTVLADHRPDAHGRCPACRSRRVRLFRRRTATPCRAYLTVQLELDRVAEPPRRSRRGRRRPQRVG